MTKMTRLIKRMVALILVLLLSIENFAAVVGDNDGAAFITKAEFDSLKNNFQSQIDQYNTSIDSKVDGAIASYLAGINVSKTYILEDLTIKAINNNENNLKFVSWREPAAARDTVDVYANFTMGEVNGTGSHHTNSPSGTNQWVGWYIITNARAWGADYTYVQYPNQIMGTGGTAKPEYFSAYYFINFPWGKYDDNQRKYIDKTDEWTLEDINRKRLNFKLDGGNVEFYDTYKTTVPSALSELPDTITTNFTLDSAAATQPTRTSATVNTGFSERAVPISINHNYYNYDSNDTSNNDFLNYNFSGSVSGSTAGIAFNYRDIYCPDSRLDISIQKVAHSASSPRSGFNVGNLHYHNTTGAIVSWITYIGVSDGRKAVTFNWIFNRQKFYNLDWDHLTNKYYDNYFDEPYYKYYGIPICKTSTNPGKASLKLKFKNKKLSTGAALTDSYTYQIMDKPFPNSTMPTTDIENGYDHVLKREIVPSGTATEYTTDKIEIEKSKIFDTSAGDYIYIKVEPSADDQVVSVEIVEDIKYTEET